MMRTLDVRRVLIVTNRPAIANSWFDDFTRFIAHQTTYRFVSESLSLAGRSPMTREQWRVFSLNHLDEDPRIVEFLSLQDLKGAQYFGGTYDKLKHIAQLDWDLLVIDEAHEGIDTTKTDVAFDQIKRKWDAALVRHAIQDAGLRQVRPGPDLQLVVRGRSRPRRQRW
jgi:type II restriction enzyme